MHAWVLFEIYELPSYEIHASPSPYMLILLAYSWFFSFILHGKPIFKTILFYNLRLCLEIANCANSLESISYGWHAAWTRLLNNLADRNNNKQQIEKQIKHEHHR